MGNTGATREGERFDVEVPVHLEQGSGVSRNVSMSGIYFVTDLTFIEGETLRFTMSFEYAIPGRQMQLDCQARVVRVEPLGDKSGVAARIEDFTCIPPSPKDSQNIVSGTNSLQ